jgi:tartrate-resistant acid phosphatase type 5
MRIYLMAILGIGCTAKEDGSPSRGDSSSAAADSGAGTGDSAEPGPQTGTVRFVAIGDAGEGNDGQVEVAAAIEALCAERGCDFALYLGDNIYNTGVDSVDDPQFEEKFELPYANLDFPFYIALGNHDYGGNGLGNEPDRVEPQIAYSDRSDKWTLPDRYYAHDQDHVRFVGLDTNALMWDPLWETGAEQMLWARGQLAGSTHPWKLAYGHHPYVSNGQHGTAGNYDGLSGLAVAAGQELKDFFDADICGTVDVYFAGHDHDMQWLEPTCGTQFLVSGAGAKTRSLEGWDQPTRFELGDTLGFLWVEIVDNTLTGVFYGTDGSILYEDSIEK